MFWDNLSQVADLVIILASKWIWDIGILVFTLLFIGFLYDALFAKVIVTESGIEYRVFMQHFFIRWNDAEEIPSIFASKILIGKISNGKRKRAIPLYTFIDNPINSELGKQIKQFAPHLFVDKQLEKA